MIWHWGADPAKGVGYVGGSVPTHRAMQGCGLGHCVLYTQAVGHAVVPQMPV